MIRRTIGCSKPSSATMASAPGLPAQSTKRLSGAPSRAIAARSSTPKTARMMTSSVIACVCGRSAKASPAGNDATARSVASRMISR